MLLVDCNLHWNRIPFYEIIITGCNINYHITTSSAARNENIIKMTFLFHVTEMNWSLFLSNLRRPSPSHLRIIEKLRMTCTKCSAKELNKAPSVAMNPPSRHSERLPYLTPIAAIRGLSNQPKPHDTLTTQTDKQKWIPTLIPVMPTDDRCI